VAAIVRGAGDTLQRQCGAAALEVLLEALDDAQREIERSFAEDTDDGFGGESGAGEPPDAI
jgi:hypothetical protein